MNTIHPSARIVDGVKWGENNTIGAGVVIGGFKGGDCDITIGDNNDIHENVRILVDTFILGDGNVLHNHISIIGGHVRIDDNCWIGQYGVLDGVGTLRIHDNVAIGFSAHVCTHARRPNQPRRPDGCLLEAARPTTIMKGAWLMGSNIVINSGITIASKSIVLPNSVITKDTVARKVYGGIPAKELNIKGWK